VIHYKEAMSRAARYDITLQVLAAAAAYNTVLTPSPVVVGDEGMQAIRGVLEAAAQVRTFLRVLCTHIHTIPLVPLLHPILE